MSRKARISKALLFCYYEELRKNGSDLQIHTWNVEFLTVLNKEGMDLYLIQWHKLVVLYFLVTKFEGGTIS